MQKRSERRVRVFSSIAFKSAAREPNYVPGLAANIRNIARAKAFLFRYRGVRARACRSPSRAGWNLVSKLMPRSKVAPVLRQWSWVTTASRNYNVEITILIYQNTTDVIKEIDVTPPTRYPCKIHRLNYDAANYSVPDELWASRS